ncbi:MAG TPA: NTF2 fold immunity protein [Terriglobales bacterium]|nr:NTF2 fold immunity protein [Terriglobales bacterium]
MHHRKGKFRLASQSAVLVIALELFAAVALGQDSGLTHVTNLRAVVSDPSGARLPGAEITFRGEKTVTVSAGEDGSVLVQIPYGDYAVTISRTGFETAKIANLSIQSAKPPDLEVVLQVGHCCDEPGIAENLEPQIITSDLPNLIETVRVPDAATAISIAEPALIKKYAKRRIDDEKPLVAILQNGVWNVHTTRCCTTNNSGQRKCVLQCFGGGDALELRQSDGKILSFPVWK